MIQEKMLITFILAIVFILPLSYIYRKYPLSLFLMKFVLAISGLRVVLIDMIRIFDDINIPKQDTGFGVVLTVVHCIIIVVMVIWLIRARIN